MSGLKATMRAALAVAVACAAMAVAGVATAAPAWPTHQCGSFRHWVAPSYGLRGFWYRISVLNSGVSCQTATVIVRAFWSGRVVHHGGPSDAQSWWTLPGYPGWRCGQGAGAGLCSRQSSTAAYEVSNG